MRLPNIYCDADSPEIRPYRREGGMRNYTTVENFLGHAWQEISYFSWFFVNFVVNKIENIFDSGMRS
jgi:hypothetical protein